MHPPPAVRLSPLHVVLLLAAVAFGSWLAWRYDPAYLAEEGGHEWLEALVLFGGAWANGRASGWGRAPEPGMLLRAGLAMLCLSFGLREVEIDDFGDPAVWKPVEHAVRGVGLALWAVLLVVAARRLRGRSLRGELLARPWAFHVLVVLAGLFLLASWPFDKGRVAIDPALSHFFEETLELCGYALLLAAAWLKPQVPPT